FVRDYRSTVVQSHRITVYVPEDGAASLLVHQMARRAPELLKHLLTLAGHGSHSAAALKPVLVFRGFHDRDPSDHSRMLRAAVLGAEQVIATLLGRRERHRVVVPRADVAFYAER